jgi:hypothetical protein
MNRFANASRQALSRSLPLIAATLATLLSGCVQPTVFTGDPKIPAGAQGCVARCRQEGLAMSAFIVMGEYSTGCVCQVPGAGPPSSGVTASVSAAAAGVAMQMRRQEEQKRQEQLTQR